MVMVVDASVALAWCIEAESTADSVALLDRLRTERGVVPSIWPFEVANALLIAERRGRLRPAHLERAIRLVLALPITVAERPLPDTIGAVLPLAREQSLSVYDASYLDVALREGGALATLDGRLRRAAERVGVALAGGDGKTP